MAHGQQLMLPQVSPSLVRSVPPALAEGRRVRRVTQTANPYGRFRTASSPSVHPSQFCVTPRLALKDTAL